MSNIDGFRIDNKYVEVIVIKKEKDMPDEDAKTMAIELLLKCWHVNLSNHKKGKAAINRLRLRN